VKVTNKFKENKNVSI